MALLLCLLISLLSIPFSNLLLSLTRILLTPIVQLHARAHFTWPPGSRFRRIPSGRTQALRPCDINLLTALYERQKEAAECVFCLSDIEEGEEIRELRCKHLFHRRCLDRWLVHRRATCPLCRDTLLPREPAAVKGGDEVDVEEELDDSSAVLLAYVQWWMW
ncbi:hypothetical protein OPV22_031596 [Ensete ventricosum]|uniref:RING-type domain-containing protein n=1 Tax=Ensete ventricosum TaxID=4639 RepID=A0AAV8PUZ2_ENSVE|nr:hypothetical protein OPV22_031596 [Ensete ventricosum]